jgi:hypothetical protein
MLALMKPKNAVTVSIIATVLSAPGCRQKRHAGPHSQKDFEPAPKIAIRLMICCNTVFRKQKAAAKLFRLLSLRRCRVLGTLGHHRVIFGSAAPRRSALRQAAHPVRHVGNGFAWRFASSAIRKRQACEAQKGPSELGTIHLGVMPSV